MTPEQRTRLVKLMRMQPWGVNFTSPDQDCIRAALAEIDRLYKHNLDLQRSYDEACSDAAGYESEALRLRAENDRLTAEVARWRHLYESQHMPKHDGFKPTEAP